jgi:carbon-monoxide dehydrogenase iron sulfur subunit
MRRIRDNEDVCIGCRLCEISCIVEHSLSHDILKAFKSEQPRPSARISVGQGKDGFLAVRCQHCPEPPCVYACLTGALSRDPLSGLVLLDSGKCVGCWTCVISCPFGAIAPDTARGAIAKCDMCPELDVPACVAGCSNRALAFEETLGAEAAPLQGNAKR